MTEISNISTDDLETELERRKKIKNAPPEPLSNPDYTGLQELVTNYIAFCDSDDYHPDSGDWDHYIYAAAIEAFYPKEKFWAWYRKLTP